MAEQTCGCQPGDISTETVATTVETQIANLDPQRAAAFSGLQTARTARATGYAREQKRLALKYGADSPRVVAVAEKSRFNEGLRRDVAFEVARAKTETPTVDKGGYVFHGFVRDLKGQGIPRLTVALYDEKGNLIREMGFGCTDDRGYFLMRYQRGKTDQPSDVKPTLTNFQTASAGKPAAGRAAATGATTSQARVAVRIYVLDAKQTTLQIEKEPLHPQLGEVDFRIIVLGAETAPCTPPPDKPGEAEKPKPKPKPNVTTPTVTTPTVTTPVVVTPVVVAPGVGLARAGAAKREVKKGLTKKRKKA